MSLEMENGMLASEMVAQLTKLIEKHGDMPVVTHSHCSASWYLPELEVIRLATENGRDYIHPDGENFPVFVIEIA